MIQWIRRHVDPDELLVIVYVIVCAWRGFAAWDDLVGKPRDAPHLQIAPHTRALLWWACCAAGIVGLRIPRGCKIRIWALSPMGVGAMFSFVFSSYMASWVASWPPVDALIPDEVLQGDPHAWGSLPYYVLGVCWAIAIMLAPWDWTYADRPTTRAGRLERKGRR